MLLLMRVIRKSYCEINRHNENIVCCDMEALYPHKPIFYTLLPQLLMCSVGCVLDLPIMSRYIRVAVSKLSLYFW